MGVLLFAINIDREKGVLNSLKRIDDQFDTDYLIADGIGAVDIRYRKEGGNWCLAQTECSDDIRVVTQTAIEPLSFHIAYTGDSENRHGIRTFELIETFENKGTSLDWLLEFHNKGDQPIELGEISLPLHFSTNYVQDNRTTYTERVIRHSFVSGNGSFILLMRPNAIPPFLVMTPLAATRLEYYGRTSGGGSWEGTYFASIHSVYQAEAESRGTWRQPRTSVVLERHGKARDSIKYGFRFRWAADYEEVRTILYEEGLFDIHVVPGMTVPIDLKASLSLRGQYESLSLIPEFADQTRIDDLGTSGDAHRYQISFKRLGENRITVRFDQEREFYLEFFVTESLEVLIHKRAAFIVRNQQVRDPEKWYDGLFSLWDMQELVLRTPDDLNGLAYPYMVGGSDDPCLGKAPFVATKNLHFPNKAEISAIEYYLEHFVWGGLQRTDKENPHPFGIYGVDNWYVNRNSEIGFISGGHGKEHLWRTFDYPHLILLYFTMYHIARHYPEWVHYLDASGYLARAYGTARAYFTVPMNIKMGEPFFIKGWSDWAYKQGNFHELVIPDLIRELDRSGLANEAGWLRQEWEKKVKYFVYDHPYPYGSEMFFDSTGFESTHMIARYGIENKIMPDTNLWYDRNRDVWYSHPEVKHQDFHEFMERQIQANIAARGWLESSYYLLGSDYRGGGNTDYLLSYMTQMGGWSIVDYALYYSDDPTTYLRLGYASFLASWALINSGPHESNYGFWYPGAGNDGAAGWAFKAEQYGRTWMGRDDSLSQGRGLWRYDGEIDNGFSGALRTAATIVVDDPIFGLFCYGGTVEETSDTYAIRSMDGLRQRLHLLVFEPRVHLFLERDGFSSSTQIVIGKSLEEISFRLENRYSQPHQTQLSITGLPAGRYRARIEEDGAFLYAEQKDSALVFSFPIGQKSEYDILIESTHNNHKGKSKL